MTSICFERVDVPHDGEGGPCIRMRLKPNMRPQQGDTIRLQGLQKDQGNFAFYLVDRIIIWPERDELVAHVKLIRE